MTRASIDMKDYAQWVHDVAAKPRPVTKSPWRDKVLLATVGLSGELGEVTEIIKKSTFHGKQINLEHLKEEIGDVLWYLALLVECYGFDFENIAAENVQKLVKRNGHAAPAGLKT